MTRRERHIRILESFGRVGQYDRDNALRRMGLRAYTDEAIEEMARATVSGHQHHQKLAAESRAIYAQQRSKGAA